MLVVGGGVAGLFFRDLDVLKNAKTWKSQY